MEIKPSIINMLSNTLISILALTSAVSASPALRRQADPCQDAYKSCIAAGTPEVACSCTLTACVGEDNARNREYCASATANLPKSSAKASTTAKPAVCPTALFDGCNPARSACPDGPGTFTTVSPSTYPTSYVINGQTVSLTAAPTSCLPTGASSAASSAAPSASASASGCVAKYNTCRTTRVNGLSANQAQCASDNAACQGDCYAKYNTCRTTRVNGLSANQAQCASEYAGCLGENPIASTGGLISSFIPYSATVSSSAAPTTMVSSKATTTAAAPKASGTNAAAPGSNPKKVDGKTWSLNNVNRYCGDGNTGCDYNFDIIANGKTEHCTVIRMPGSNAATESFSNQPCGDFSVSWGYVKDPAPAYAVLTVVDKASELAWFGVSNINGQAVTPSNPFGSGQYGNVGPEQVYTYN
ncbi:hypothetical protein D6D01_02987 [Aureobasidium pullulans]|uniref:Uncharacterized protein n=1 Tax=Aureobasidium pullulans TaxID=5580 RepID=A0A4S9LN94_AURPU|nr:hypothetical protein D6D01_02987 [Aureobasidium pullulans]